MKNLNISFFIGVILVFSLSSCGVSKDKATSVLPVESTTPIVSVSNTKIQPITPISENESSVVSENDTIGNTGTIRETGSGNIVENITDYSQINGSAKIYDAYISDITEKFTEESYNNLFNKEVVDKDSLVELSNTVYFKDKKSVYCHPWCQFKSFDGINPKLFKGILPNKSFTGTSDFATDEKNIFYGGKKVENGDIKSLKFKVFGNGTSIAFDKTNLYLGTEIFNRGNIENLKIVNFSKPKEGYYFNDCLTDNVSIYCVFGEFGGAPFEVLEGTDVDTFEHLAGYWYRDKNFVYFTKSKRGDIDANTFKVLDDGLLYSKDKNGVYCESEKIEGADAGTFQTLNSNNQAPSNLSKYAKDKNSIYKDCYKIEGIDPNGFDLEKYLKEKQGSN